MEHHVFCSILKHVLSYVQPSRCVLCALQFPLKTQNTDSQRSVTSPAERLRNTLSKSIYVHHLASPCALWPQSDRASSWRKGVGEQEREERWRRTMQCQLCHIPVLIMFFSAQYIFVFSQQLVFLNLVTNNITTALCV